ncbi:BTB/POZ domain-containing protein 2 isoform X1 [Mesocricetus auratus]|uniref:BTB/POZ domain-containing protein 2 isoform X1 n=1 Tax=Mesocricetus auratus TaxID=10036 RepID=A0ABM2WSR9_MESAU|nr:BTB/POZ domain-containing protein 2 isoform X1 [Mesocricetus auratus]
MNTPSVAPPPRRSDKMAAGGSGRASCPPGVGPGTGGLGPSANAAAAAGNAAACAPGPPPPPSPPPGPGPDAQAVGDERDDAGPGALLREPVYNWQATKPTVQERFAFLFNNEVLCDVHFLVGKGLSSQRVPAHRFVLAVGSAVFDAMFNGGMATTSTEIELPDVEPAAFLALLKFLYSDEVQIGPETVMTTLYTAKKYAVPALEAHCVEFLKKHLRADNAFMLLTQARLFDEPQLASLCLESIDKNTADAISAEGFTDIDLDTLVAVLERDTLGIREVRLFNAVVRWSEAECQRQQLQVTPENKRKALGKALGLIRFPLMTIEEFAAASPLPAGPAQSGILVDREVVSLFLHFTVNPKPRVEFIDRPRCCLRGKECSINRFQQVESRWGYSGTSDRIRFSVNKRIFVVGFGLYGSIHGPTDYQVNIQIIHTDSNTVLGQNDTGFSCDGSASTFRVMFKEPVEVLPNVNYTACATLKGPDSHYGTKGLRKVTHESPTTGAKTCFTFCYAAGNNNGTSVEDGQIPEVIFYT